MSNLTEAQLIDLMALHAVANESEFLRPWSITHIPLTFDWVHFSEFLNWSTLTIYRYRELAGGRTTIPAAARKVLLIYRGAWPIAQALYKKAQKESPCQS